MHVFTYGSLMFDPVWAHVVRGRYASRAGEISGFRRYAVRDVTYPGVVERAGAQVAGRLYLDVDDEDLQRLDRFEGAQYRRIVVDVATRGSDGQPERLPAGLYLFLPTERLLDGDWDPQRFEREDMGRFLVRHGAGAD
ncbi:MAG: gamma-glutamylcyclotransferase [Burkholderiales bacterium]|nr:gamma-glutamylcyclotransferase [Burkholderiales bacterium]